MSDEVVRKWVRKFNEGRDNMHDEPSVVSDVFTGGYVLRGGVQKLVPRYDKMP